MTVAESELGEPGTHGWSVIGPREPLMGAATMAKVSSQDSRSAPERVMATGVSWLVETEMGSAVGVSLTEMETEAGEEVRLPSEVVYVKESAPLKLILGV